MAPLLEVSGLARDGLGPLDLTVDRGECVVVRGRSGSGKSLLLRAIADLDPSEGRVSLDGKLRSSTPAPRWRQRVVYLAAEPGWWAPTAGEHFPDRDDATAWIARLGLPEDILARSIAILSTGERQRLALIRALLLHPPVLLLDEPTASLDDVATRAVESAVADARQHGAGVLWVSHDAAQIDRVADRVLTIEAGAWTIDGESHRE